MKMLEKVIYDKDTFKYDECVVCLKEFEESELL
jgi:hypothetical protein